MTPEQKEFAGIIYAIAEMTNTVVSDFMLQLYDEQLSPLGYPKVNAALKRVFADAGARKGFPTVNDIKKEMGASELNPDDEANLIAGNIVGAIRRIGSYNHEGAREAIGEIGWKVVNMLGGWAPLCERVHDDDLPTYTAQFRQMAKAMLNNQKREEYLLGSGERTHPLVLKLVEEMPRVNGPLKKGVGDE